MLHVKKVIYGRSLVAQEFVLCWIVASLAVLGRVEATYATHGEDKDDKTRTDNERNEAYVLQAWLQDLVSQQIIIVSIKKLSAVVQLLVRLPR